jgi:two-component system, response regulator YesN
MILVDDEVLAIEGVKSDLDLEKLGISVLFTAHNIKQAKDIFGREHIDILLCDIEMPQGTGLDLLSWVREHHPSTVTIFLTSHADFRYAKEALRLGSLDYLLKPVMASDLEQVIRRAQEVINHTSENDRNSQSHQLWMKHQSLIIERFWLDILNQSIRSTPEAIFKQAELLQIPVTEGMRFLPLLISVQNWNKMLNGRDEKIMEYALKNSAEELLLGQHTNGIFFYVGRGQLIGLMVDGKTKEWDLERVRTACEQYIDSCNRYFFCDVSCYVGEPVQAFEVAASVERLRIQDQNNVALTNKVFSCSDSLQTDQTAKLPELNLWSSLLKTGKREAVIREVDKFFLGLVENNTINAKLLHQFQQDFIQAMYSYLNQCGIQAHQLFGDEESKRMATSAGRSVADMLAWVRHSVHRAVEQAEAVEETATVVQLVQQYIVQHIDEDLSRDALANQVFLNPDYLTRIFKKETGYAISEYILLEKMKRVKELLAQTDIPISAVASTVGYSNFSHFARIFKKYVGKGPTEYRMQVRGKINR